MENKSHALAAGAFVLAVTLLLIGLAAWLMRDAVTRDEYELSTDEAVSGLQVQAPVRFKGVPVGKVTDISFDPKQRGNVLVRIAVESSAPVTRSTFATLAYQGVTGLSFVQLDDDGKSTEPPVAPPEGGAPRIPLKPSLLGQLQDRAEEMVDKVGKATDRINRMLGDENQAALTSALKEMGAAAHGANAAAQAITTLAANTDRTISAQFGPRNSSIPQLVRQTTASMKTLQDAATATQRAASRIGDAAGDVKTGMAALTGDGGVLDRLGDSASTLTATTLPRIQRMTDDASRTIRRLDRVANTLNDNPQAILYGGGAIPPGPGESGFGAPAGGADNARK